MSALPRRWKRTPFRNNVLNEISGKSNWNRKKGFAMEALQKLHQLTVPWSFAGHSKVFCSANPFWKCFFYATPLTDSLEPYILMIHVNVPLQISNVIFVYGDIIKMHTIRKGNYTVIKWPRNGNSRAKKINTKQFRLWKLSNTNGMEALDDFYTDHPFVDWY